MTCNGDTAVETVKHTQTSKINKLFQFCSLNKLIKIGLHNFRDLTNKLDTYYRKLMLEV